MIGTITPMWNFDSGLQVTCFVLLCFDILFASGKERAEFRTHKFMNDSLYVINVKKKVIKTLLLMF